MKLTRKHAGAACVVIAAFLACTATTMFVRDASVPDAPEIPPIMDGKRTGKKPVSKPVVKTVLKPVSAPVRAPSPVMKTPPAAVPNSLFCTTVEFDDRKDKNKFSLKNASCDRATEVVWTPSIGNETKMAILYPLAISNPESLKNPGVTRHLITSLYGPRVHPLTLELKDHSGLDLSAAMGSPILAGLAGYIIAMRELDAGCGYGVTIKTPNNQELTYCHMSAFVQGLGEGQSVKRGTVIGFVGASGAVTGPHIHLQVKKNGVRIDPLSQVLDFMVDPATRGTSPRDSVLAPLYL